MQTAAPADHVSPSATEVRDTAGREKGATSAALQPNSRRLSSLRAALLLLLVIALYATIFTKLVSDWISIPDDSHGLLIPFFVGFLLWEQRSQFLSLPVQSTWAGLPAIVAALLLLALGIFGADLFLTRTSFVLLAAGAIWTLLGRAFLYQCRFLLLVLLLAIPLPTIVLNQITIPLQSFASQVASVTLPLLGVPVLREGNIIQLPALPLEVAEACSGIRSLVSLFTVAVILAYFLEDTRRRQVLLVLASLPIAIAANAVRIIGTGLCVQYWDPQKAMGFFHEFSGWLIFLVSLALLYCTHLVLDRAPRRSSTQTA